MKKKICTLGAVCALLLTACGKRGNAILTTGGEAVSVGQAVPEKIQVEHVESQVITVSSRETVQAVPDKAEIVYSVTTQEKDAEACQSENHEKVGRLVEALKALGVEESSIQTSGFDLNPRYDWDRNGEIVGYEASTQVAVSDIEIGQAGMIMEKSVEAGANRILSVSFFSSNYDEKYQEALKLAVARAQEKAQALADASGCTLGRAVNITEHTSQDTYRYSNNRAEKTAFSTGAVMEDMASVMPGEIEVEARISVDYAIQ